MSRPTPRARAGSEAMTSIISVGPSRNSLQVRVYANTRPGGKRLDGRRGLPGDALVPAGVVEVDPVVVDELVGDRQAQAVAQLQPVPRGQRHLLAFGKRSSGLGVLVRRHEDLRLFGSMREEVRDLLHVFR